MRTGDVVMVGTDHAGAQAAIAPRQHDFGGSILMVGRDREPHYERSPLSKEYLADQRPFVVIVAIGIVPEFLADSDRPNKDLIPVSTPLPSSEETNA